ncbi:MAG: peptide deformylase [bacterium]
MPRLTVITTPNDHLRQKAAELKIEDIAKPETQRFIDDMIETMHTENGVGLAAPQVDKSLRIITTSHEGRAEAFVNPSLSKLSWSKVMSDEGCLSIPGVYGIVRRHRSARLTAFSREGKPISIKVSGVFAVILQHEIDHLDGILFTDKVVKYTNPPKF